jgi:hypothetical protein
MLFIKIWQHWPEKKNIFSKAIGNTQRILTLRQTGPTRKQEFKPFREAKTCQYSEYCG